MKILTVVRLYWLAIAIMLIGWCINLYGALGRPTVDWRNAAGVPSLATVFITLILLAQARRKLATDPTALVRMGMLRSVITGAALVV